MFVQAVKRDGDANGDKAVGDVERRPVIVAPIDIKKIDDFTVKNTVYEIANCAAKDKRQRAEQSFLPIFQPSE